MEMGESVMKRFGVIKKRLQEQKQVYINKNAAPQVTFEELTSARPPRVLLEPGEAPVRWCEISTYRIRDWN